MWLLSRRWLNVVLSIGFFVWNTFTTPCDAFYCSRASTIIISSTTTTELQQQQAHPSSITCSDHQDNNDTKEQGDTAAATVSRRSFFLQGLLTTSTLLATTTTATVVPAAQARGLTIFPCPNGLGNTYHLMRAGSSLLEEDDIWETNPLFLTNQDAALSSHGREQVDETIEWMKETNLNPTMIRYSLATSSVDTANRINQALKIGRDHMVPEFNFMDPRAIGAWDASTKHRTEAAVWAMDMDEAGKDGVGARPPPNEDGTPNETLSDQVVRLTNLMSVLETQFSAESILLVFPDGTGPAVLSCMMAGIPLNRVHELEYMSGEVRVNVNYHTTVSLLKEREEEQQQQRASDEEMNEYQIKLENGRKQLLTLRKSSSSTSTRSSDQRNNMALSKKYRQEEEEQRAIEANVRALAQQREDEEQAQRLERQRVAVQLEAERQQQRRQREATERREQARQQRQRIAEDRGGVRQQRVGGVLASTGTMTTGPAVDPIKAIVGTLALLGIGALGTQRQKDNTSKPSSVFQPAFSSSNSNWMGGGAGGAGGDWESSFEEDEGPTEPQGVGMSKEELDELPEPPVPTMSEKYIGWSMKKATEYAEKNNREYWEEYEKEEGKKRFLTADEALDKVRGYCNDDIPTASVYDNYDQDDDDAWLGVLDDIMNEDDDGENPSVSEGDSEDTTTTL